MKETILQFGEGNFLRAFVGDFIDALNRQGLYDGKIVIVKPRPGGLDRFTRQNCRYHLILRGVEQGERVSRIREIGSVSRAIDPYTDFDGFLALARNPDLRFVVSNTTEAGVAFDGSCRFDDAPAASFPGKLTQFLYERYRAGRKGLVMLPCELIDDNGGTLKRCVLQYAALWGLDGGFTRWLETENAFCNTLVDRIVTGFPQEEADALCPGDALLDTAEPYHLWAIEGHFEDELPLRRAGCNVVWTDDVRPLKKRKVRLLNGAHTATVFPALLAGLETVGDCLKDADAEAFLRGWLLRCALPALGESDGNAAFANTVLERFANPYIRHLLTSIALNSVSKFAVRVLPTAQDLLDRTGAAPRAAAVSLAALLYYYKNCQPSDDENAVRFIRENDVEAILRSDIFGADVRFLTKDALAAYEMIGNGSVREAMRWAVM